MDTEEVERQDISYVKAKAKNNVETRILEKTLRQIDKQRHCELTRIAVRILSAKRFARGLRQQGKKYKDVNNVDEVISHKKDNIKQSGRTSVMMRSASKLRNGDNVIINDADSVDGLNVAGQKMPTEEYHYVPPKMFFWSQDASTKEAVLTGFYGYKYGLQRPMTEVKLLGQRAFPEPLYTASEIRRDVHTADEIFRHRSSLNTSLDPRRIYTSGVPKTIFDDDNMDGGQITDPPPTREVTFVRNTPSQNMRNPSGQDKRTKLPKLENTVRPSSPQGLSINLKRSESAETVVSHRTAGLASRGSLRTPRVRMKNPLQLQTNEDPVRERNETISAKTKILKPAKNAELERSYAKVPVILAEVLRLNSTGDVDPKPILGQYAKSQFRVNMQNTTSKRVLNRSPLPASFRKRNNTLLKHYSASDMYKSTQVFSMQMPV
ncbi:hypothetical protein DPMN_099350 [Dreissena polymorpha]|uniref:Uncharacterized protein n=1 Tax=Dreissena polymorpha TaxID=45954 RepID=A0A9D4R6C2_DREPO|nr:hypothetical protein DPMN_099350 [Dreissena polymorpha]